MINFELPPNFIADLSAQATQIMADLAPLWTLFAGLLFAFFIIQLVIEFFMVAKTINITSEVISTERANTKINVDEFARDSSGQVTLESDDVFDLEDRYANINSDII